MSWQIDSSHSQIDFSVRHMMISKVRGEFETFTGIIHFDIENPENTTVDVTIDTTSINTRDEQRDGHLTSPDFLNVAEFPTMHFKSSRVEKINESSGKLFGQLTIRGITREVVLDVEYAGQAKSPWGTISAGFSAKTSINRKEWGLTWNQALETGGVLVGEKIEINIELELMKQSETAAA